MGPSTLTWLDIDAYCRVKRVQLDPADLQIIRELENVYMEAVQEKSEKDKKKAESDGRKHQTNPRR